LYYPTNQNNNQNTNQNTNKNTFVWIQLILDSSTKPRLKSDLLLPARKIGSDTKQKATHGLQDIEQCKRRWEVMDKVGQVQPKK